MLTPDQYGRQVRVRPDSAEVVDFAVHLPGTSEEGRVLLPVDCKFPHEDYERLLAAQDAGDPVAVELAAKGLERAIRLQAKSIREKYVHPPHTTNFAVMYLPTEGLFAEVVRRPGLTAELSASLDITVTGPTTLAALLNSLKMGFQTLRIQKNASDIMQTLGEAKRAFNDYGTALEAVDKKLDEAKKKVADVGVRHRAVHRKLRGVEALEDAAPALGGQGKLLSLAGLPEDEDEAA
jgi:DNA recombination protein RmuC